MTRRRPPLLALVPVLAFLTLLAWVFASPIGAGPDDDYHLISTWCAGTTADDTCAPADQGGGYHEVSVELVEISCFAGDAEQSAACQEALFDGDMTDDTVVSDRGNFYGEYPPLYYAVMSAFTSGDVQTSALLMRVFTITLFVGILTALYLLLPAARRSTLVVGWLVTTVPLGIFLLASNNPSAWATIGVGTSWLALLGYFETTGWRRVALGALYALGVVMAAGSRGDAAVYVGFATALVLVYVFRPRREFFIAAVLPAIMGVIALASLLLSGQAGAGLSGLGEGSASETSRGVDTQELSTFGRLAYNVLNAPFIWAGALGEWGLGWLDTAMPAIVILPAIMAFVMAGFLGFGRIGWRKATMVGAVIFVLWALPVFVLQQGGDTVGEQLQPRYLLPLIVLLGGLLALDLPAANWRRAQLVVVTSALAIAHAGALYFNLRRYLTGVGTGGLDLGVDPEWWWSLPFSPMFVWLGGSLAYAALMALIVTRVLAPGPHDHPARR
ncbi:MAG: DUF2142 domain-containing protein [Pseudolysinimonas sp.]|uniref:DUF2142 domain-containing protein n=1 Tax=Pseudolysinimonas sp. TaxID=2680009 RepID=UPI003C733D08